MFKRIRDLGGKTKYNIKRIWERLKYDMTHNTIHHIRCEDDEGKYGEYFIEIDVFRMRETPKSARIHCNKSDCNNSWCEYFLGNKLETKLEPDQIMYLTKTDKINPRDKPCFMTW